MSTPTPVTRADVVPGYIFTFDGVLTPSECAAHVARAEDDGFETATIDGPGGPALRPGVRNNARTIFDDHDLAATLWARVAPAMPQSVAESDGWQPSGLNERFRVYRYDPGQSFAPHTDGRFVRSEDEVSLLSFLIYLNADYEGGETCFRGTPVAPAAGRALAFVHRLEHEGRSPARGRKYVLRTDVMFRRAGG